MTRARDIVLIALAWAVTWAPLAVVVGLVFIDPDNSMDEMWPVIGAYPGFLSGLLFGIGVHVLGSGGFRDLSYARGAALGAVSGFLVGVLPFMIGEPSVSMPVWLFALIAISTFVGASVISALATLAVVRMLLRRGSVQRTAG